MKHKLQDSITIALDAMGGDQAPQSVLRGAELAKERYPHLHFIIFGDTAKIEPILKGCKRLKESAEIVHTDNAISATATAVAALRQGKDSSMRLALEAVKDGRAAASVSAGNTGALMAMSKVVLGTVAGIKRPAFASFFPTMQGQSVMLDLGANTECDAENLVQFALMGEVFARTAFGLQEPSVGLLNIGSEEQKGHGEVREAADILRKTNLPIRFEGFVEGDDISKGTVDVIVTDGFTGNVALKTIEGTAKLCYSFFREAFRSSILARIGYIFARAAFTKLRARLDPRRYNGAIFLGLDGISVKSHGGTDAFGYATAIGLAHDLVQQGFLPMIREEIESLGSFNDLSALLKSESADKAAKKQAVA